MSLRYNNEEGDPNRPVTPPGNRVLLDWRASQATWKCHWFPMKATSPPDEADPLRSGGDPYNNTFAPGGPLDKYDRAYGLVGEASARRYEVLHSGHYYTHDAPGVEWFGHCNNASEVSCLLKEPARAVVHRGVHFSQNDVCALLCRVSSCFVGNPDFCGRRYNGSGDVAGDPRPAVLLRTLRTWGADRRSFVLDIVRTEAVWNYAFDSVTVTECDSMPGGGPRGWRGKYNRFVITSTGFPEENREYWATAGEDGTWLATGGEDDKMNPDFAWRPVPCAELAAGPRQQWRGTALGNPMIEARLVQEIYLKSI